MLMNECEIEQRNAARRESWLPVLDPATELARLRQIKADAEFEMFFAKRRSELKHRWEIAGAGFLSRMALYQTVRRQLRREFDERRDRSVNQQIDPGL